MSSFVILLIVGLMTGEIIVSILASLRYLL